MERWTGAGRVVLVFDTDSPEVVRAKEATGRAVRLVFIHEEPKAPEPQTAA